MMILQKTVSTSCQVKKHMWLFSSTTLRPCFGILEGMCCGLFFKLHSSFHLTCSLPEEGKIKIKAFPFIISFNFLSALKTAKIFQYTMQEVVNVSWLSSFISSQCSYRTCKQRAKKKIQSSSFFRVCN